MQRSSSTGLTRPSARQRNAAFTLVELVVVIVVLGILGSIALPRFIDFSDASKRAATEEGLIYLREQIQLTYLKSAVNGSKPDYPSIGALRTLTNGNRPVNPYSSDEKNESRILRIGNNTASAQVGAGGWAYNPTTGAIWANSKSGAEEHTW